MHNTNQQLLEFGSLIDEAVRSGVLRCQSTVDLYDAIIADAPTYDMSGYDAVTQRAYDHYRQTVDVFENGAWDMVHACHDYLNSEPDEKGFIPFQQWGLARQRVNDAGELVNQAIRWLEEQ